MSLESKYSVIGSSIYFKETFNSATDTAKNGGSITDVSYSNGVGSFNGSSSVINYKLGQIGNWDDSDYSIRVKFKTPSSFLTGRYYGLISKRTSADSNNFWQFAHDGGGTTTHQAKFILNSEGSNKITTISGNLDANTWYDAIVVVNLTTNKSQIYLNGNASGSEVGIISNTFSTTSDIKVGFESVNNSYFNGDIDFVEIYNKALTAEEVSNLYNKTLYKGLVTNGLVGYWDFTRQTVYDFSNNGNNGTLTAGTGGFKKQGLEFDGSDTKVEVALPSDLSSGSAFSFVAIINAKDAVDNQNIFTSQMTATIGGGLNLFNNTIRFHCRNGGSNDVTYNSPIDTNKDVMLVGTFLSGKGYLYIGSDLVASNLSLPTTVVFGVNGLAIGTSAGAGFDYFNGNFIKISGLYNRALSANEIAQNYQYFKGRFNL